MRLQFYQMFGHPILSDIIFMISIKRSEWPYQISMMTLETVSDSIVSVDRLVVDLGWLGISEAVKPNIPVDIG